MTPKKIFKDMEAAFWRDFRRWATIATVEFALAGTFAGQDLVVGVLALVPAVITGLLATICINTAEGYRELARTVAESEE